MRTLRLAAAAALLSGVAGATLTQALAQSDNANQTQAAPAPAAKPAPAGDPVVARVGDVEIHGSDVQEAFAGLPPQYREMPQALLYPMILDQLIDRKAVALKARAEGLQNDPAVKRQIARSEEGVLQNALLSREVMPKVTDAAVKAKYDATVAGKPGEEEVHARHILVDSEDTAKKIVEDLKKGGDFAAIAKAQSKDPGAAQQGGDLGWFKRGDMLPEFAEAAFNLKPGEITQTPVHTQYGWHVIKLEERRQAPPPSFEQARDEIRQGLIREQVEKVVASAKTNLKVEKFNPDGSVPKPTDAAEPPAAPAPAQK